MKNNSYYFLVSFFLLFVSIQSCLLSQINQSSSIIGEYSYSEIIGLDVSIGPNDYLSLSKDGTFEYEVGLINAFGQWSLIEDTLKFHYNSPIDTVRLFKIVELSSTKLHLSEGLLQFKFTHSFSNKVNMFSKGVNDL